MNGFLKELVSPVTQLLDKVIPDTDEKNRIAFELATMAESHAQNLALAQIEVNKEAAKHPSMFVAGARPAAIWVCVAGLAMQVILRAVGYGIAVYFAALMYFADDPTTIVPFVLPAAPVLVDLALLGALLGLGGARTVEKVMGVSRNNMGAGS